MRVASFTYGTNCDLSDIELQKLAKPLNPQLLVLVTNMATPASTTFDLLSSVGASYTYVYNLCLGIIIGSILPRDVGYTTKLKLGFKRFKPHTDGQSNQAIKDSYNSKATKSLYNFCKYAKCV